MKMMASVKKVTVTRSKDDKDGEAMLPSTGRGQRRDLDGGEIFKMTAMTRAWQRR